MIDASIAGEEDAHQNNEVSLIWGLGPHARPLLPDLKRWLAVSIDENERKGIQWRIDELSSYAD